MSTQIHIGICGAAGRMGRTLIEASAEQADVTLAGAFEHDGHPALGTDADVLVGLPTANVAIESDLAGRAGSLDTVIEFTLPEPTLAHVEMCRAAGVQMVIGTTGLTAEEEAAVVEAAKSIPVVMAPNMSLGVNLLMNLVNRRPPRCTVRAMIWKS